ncbi:hypothetical protein [Nonomuraea angiospora]|uniref:hypothetical protein n=1 Tax=Nonomuraea angiospora TaxID=46172 RepID=UPI0029ACB017|nr:hypothetical protein [Nonomuraea angiospora]MDX3100457.1 hypothetical protein [Nonomuraea angiospora]
MLRIPWLSVEYVKVPITTGPPELTELPVHMAILPKGQDPGSGDWKPAAWIGIRASVLIGPGTMLPLDKGLTYGIWVKITSSPETPVLGPFPLHIT